MPLRHVGVAAAVMVHRGRGKRGVFLLSSQSGALWGMTSKLQLQSLILNPL